VTKPDGFSEKPEDICGWVKDGLKYRDQRMSSLPPVFTLYEPELITIFEPLEIEILEDRRVYHRLIFSAGNEAGSLRIRDLPCLSGFNNTLGVTTIQIHGLSKEPEINEKEKRIKIIDGSSSLDLKYSTITIDRSLCKVEL
jgi:hypothetical protein